MRIDVVYRSNPLSAMIIYSTAIIAFVIVMNLMGC